MRNLVAKTTNGTLALRAFFSVSAGLIPKNICFQ
jgi:hypothetical protein